VLGAQVAAAPPVRSHPRTATMRALLGTYVARTRWRGAPHRDGAAVRKCQPTEYK